MDATVIIVEFGRRRQRVQWDKVQLNIDDLRILFARTFTVAFDWIEYDVFLNEKSVDQNTTLDLHCATTCHRFKIQRKTPTAPIRGIDTSSTVTLDTGSSLEHRLRIAAVEISHVALLIDSLRANCRQMLKVISNNDDRTLAVVDAHEEPEWHPTSNHSPSHEESGEVQGRMNDFSSSSDLTKPLDGAEAPKKKKNVLCKYAAGSNCKRGNATKLRDLLVKG